MCAVDSDNDGLPDKGISCTEWGCAKVGNSVESEESFVMN